MECNSIKDLRSIRDEIRDSIKSIKPKEYPDIRYGQENEYEAKSIKVGIEGILSDITALTKSPNRCIQKTTFDERILLNDRLNNIHTYIESKDLENLANSINEIKPILRNTGVRYWDERLEVFDEATTAQQKKASELSENIESFDETLKKAATILEAISVIKEDAKKEQTNISELHQELIALTTETNNLRKEIQDGIEQDTNNSSKIKDILNESKTHSEVINTFSEKIAQREIQLEGQKTETEEYSKKLLAFEKKHENYLEQAENLITEAENSLQLSATEGISSAFNGNMRKLRLLGASFGSEGAAIFVLIAIIISLDIFGFVNISELLGIKDTDVKANNINGILARFLLIPIPLTVAWFCAMQYVKQKNIIEDYAYKSVLAKSLVGFSNQLATDTNKGEDYAYFIQSVFKELHKDPLRKHHKEFYESKASEKISNRLTEVTQNKSDN